MTSASIVKDLLGYVLTLIDELGKDAIDLQKKRVAHTKNFYYNQNYHQDKYDEIRPEWYPIRKIEFTINQIKASYFAAISWEVTSNYVKEP